MGVIGFTKHGVAILNLLTAEYANAVEGPNAETFDSCDGHPTDRGVYHYHKLPSSCVYSGTTDEFLGVAIDGIPFYGPKVSWKTSDVTSSDLDDCNGKTVNGEYRYYVTRDWPYFMGCLRGQVVDPTYITAVNSYTCGSTSVFDACGYLCPCANVRSFKDSTCSAASNRLSLMVVMVSTFTILRVR
ncbi:hypothetical protein KUTeg_020932 [Tegillarca granosa]|uniref:YHYH domain-containing protein n=1 Tax=Tegillarca granosa TaxID=220873 RepID=A0ABQ9EEM1_TEGGR|nr:hypothetical protein KUTeg_020932 [Tegillarca granosa]